MSPTDNLPRYFTQFGLYAKMVCQDYGFVHLLAAFVPLVFLHRMNGRGLVWMLGLLAVFVFAAFFILDILNISHDWQSLELVRKFFTPSHLLLAIFTGIGLVLGGTLLARELNGKN